MPYDDAPAIYFDNLAILISDAPDAPSCLAFTNISPQALPSISPNLSTPAITVDKPMATFLRSKISSLVCRTKEH